MLVCILTTHDFSSKNRHVQDFITNCAANWQVGTAPAVLCTRDERNFQVSYIPLLWRTGLVQEPQASEVKDK